MTDLTHNVLADFHATALVGTPFEGFGPKQIVRDLLTIEGKLILEAGQLKRIELLASHPNSESLLDCLVGYCGAMDVRTTDRKTEG